MSKKARRARPRFARKSRPRPGCKRVSKKARQVHPELVLGSRLNPPAGGKWVSDWGGIIQSYELEPSSAAEAFKAAIEAGVSAFEGHKENLLTVLLNARGSKSQPFDQEKTWDRLSRLAWEYFWQKRVKQETRPARDRSKRLDRIANVLNKASRLFDDAKQDTLIDDLYSAWCELNVRDDALRVQPVSATPLVVYRLAFGSPRSFAGVD